MSKLRVSARLAAGALVFLLHAGEPAHACSVCLPGDPHFSGLGANAGERGDFSLYLETRGFSKRSGALPHDHEEEEHAGNEESRVRSPS